MGRQFGGARPGPAYLDRVGRPFIAVEGQNQQIGVAVHDRQQVVEVVGHTPRQPPESLHLGSLAQLLFEDFVLGEVFHGSDGDLGLAGALSHRRDVDPDPDLPAALCDIALLHFISVIAAGKQVVEQSPSRVSVRGVREVEDVQLAQFGVVVAEEPAECRVAFKPLPIPVDQEHSQRRLVEDGPNTSLARLEGGFGCPAGRYVTSHELDGRSPVECHRGGDDLHVERRAVQSQMALLHERLGLAAGQHATHPDPNQVLLFGRNVLDHGPAIHLHRATRAIHLDGGAVDEHGQTVLMDDDGVR